jgi:hypothetical protein
MSSPFMTSRLLKYFAAPVLLALPALLTAQEGSSSENERLERLLNDPGQTYVPKTTMRIGFRMLDTGGTVQYGNLGIVASNVGPVPPISDGAVTRVYNNGIVSADAPRTEEKDADGNQISTPGGRYQIYTTITVDVVDDAGNITGTEEIQVLTNDYLSYSPGRTRVWGYATNRQETGDGRIAFSTYNVTSDGATVVQDSDAPAGVEFEFDRAFGQLTKRIEWGVSTAASIGGINNKAGGSVLSTLNTNTDYYSLAGLAAPGGPYGAPSFGPLYDDDGLEVNSVGYETTTPINSVPDFSTSSSLEGGVNVNGYWKVKGAYFMMKLGPSLRFQLTQRLSLNASAGVAGAFAGSTYSVIEIIDVPDIGGETISTPELEEDRESKFLSGFYADLSIAFATSDRTGIFWGVTAQQFGDYSQELNGRTALIDLGNSVGVRGGISMRF